MCLVPPWIYPVAMAVYLPVACFITYGVAVSRDHVIADFPFISKTGDKPPESCVFSLLFNGYAIISAVTMFVRYKQEYAFYWSRQQMAVVNTQRVGLVFGLLAAIGVALVGNFQQNNVSSIHHLGAFMGFGLGVIYGWIQSVVSYFMPELPGSVAIVRHIRLLLSIAQTVSLIYFVAMMYKVMIQREMSLYRHATISEWVLAFSESTYFLTFVWEFRHTKWSSTVSFPPRGVDHGIEKSNGHQRMFNEEELKNSTRDV